MSERAVPASLRTWFAVHCYFDLAFAVPLMVAPEWTLQLLGWTTVDPVATRLVSAALFGIGISSWVCRSRGAEVLGAMLELKIIWSTMAIAGLVWSLVEGAPPLVWLFLAIFLAFDVVWETYRRHLGA